MLKNDNLLQPTQTSYWKRTSAKPIALRHTQGHRRAVRTQQGNLGCGGISIWVGLSWAPTFLQKHQVTRMVKTNVYLLNLLPFAHCTCLQKVLSFHLEDFILKIQQDENYLKDDGLFSFDISEQVPPSNRNIFFWETWETSMWKQTGTKCE